MHKCLSYGAHERSLFAFNTKGRLVKPQEVKLGKAYICSFYCDELQWDYSIEQQLVEVSRMDSKSALVRFVEDAQTITVTAKTYPALEFLDVLEDADLKSFCWLVGATRNEITIEMRVFSQDLHFGTSTPLELLIPDAILRNIQERFHTDDPVEFLTDQFVLMDEMMFMIINVSEAMLGGYRLVGSSYCVNVNTDSAKRSFVEMPVKRRHNEVGGAPIVIARGAMRFIAGHESHNQTDVDSQIIELQNTQTRYLDSLSIYRKLEKILVEQEALQFGYVQYGKAATSRKGRDIIYEFRTNSGEHLRNFGVGRTLVAVADAISIGAEDADEVFKGSVEVGDVLQSDPEQHILATSLRARMKRGEPPEQGYLFTSLRRDIKRLQRQKEAIELIGSGQAAIANLARIIEDGDWSPRTLNHIGPLSKKTEKALGHKATLHQREALDVALNSPDISVIQGPPGTGKTSVIRALITRFIEVEESRCRSLGIENPKPRVLVTSYQHDAVDNAVEDFEPSGLPVWRLGGRYNEQGKERSAILNAWASQQRAKCQQKLDELGGVSARIAAGKIAEIANHILVVGGAKKEQRLRADEALCQAEPFLDSMILSNARINLDYIYGDKNADFLNESHNQELKTAFRNILDEQRLSLNDFRIDGPFQVRRLNRFLDSYGVSIGQVTRPIVVDLQKHEGVEVDEELERKLIDLERTVQEYRESIEQETDDTREEQETQENAFKELRTIADLLHAKADASEDGIRETLSELIASLDEENLLEAIAEKYSDVVAASCSQSAIGEYQVYDLVVVDEAARANPRDLLIPISMGKKVVLVGDQKQLPHMLEPQVIEKLRLKLSEEDVKEYLKKSMFERLIETFKTQEGRGAPKRTAILRDDFRMHPVISKYVSDTFYGGLVESHSSSETRQHKLGLYNNCPIAWLDVLNDHSGENPGLSKARPAEIQVILDEVAKISEIDSKVGIGIITFYSRQRELIEKRVEELPYEIKRNLHVGTVDSFQGKEFDIVFLSTVRSNNRTGKLFERVGHISVSSRLCVALSRAKKLLVIVGDSDTIAGSSNNEGIPELCKLLALCKNDNSEEGFYERR